MKRVTAKLEITTEGGHIVIRLRNAARSYGPPFWNDAVQDIRLSLPHAHVEIERVTVSEKEPAK